MKALIEFSLPEESDDYQLAIDAQRLRNALVDIREALRRLNKNTPELLDGDTVSYILNLFSEILGDNELNRHL